MIIIAVTAVTLLCLAGRPRLPVSWYLALCGLALIYLLLGLLYNVTVYTFWKTYFYDVKVFLYLTVPYLFLHSIDNERIKQWFRPERVFIYGAFASLFDLFMVTAFGRSEYPSYLGLPPWPPLVPVPVLLIGLLFARQRRHKLVLGVLIGLEIVNLINRLSLGALFALGVSIVYVIIAMPRLSYAARVGLVLSAVVGVNLFAVVLIGNPLGWPLLSTKADGVAIRQTQLENVLLNFEHNFPVLTGKGLGATWFEYVKAKDPFGYSTGTSVGATFQESLDAPVKFIFNWTPPSLLYKWGFLGIVAICVLASAFYYSAYAKIRRLRSAQSGGESLRYLQAALLIAFVFVLDNFTYIGQLRLSLITSLLAFYVENELRRYAARADQLTVAR